MPPHITFGGKRSQLLRMKGKISREEYRKRKNSILISRGDKSKKGNLNTRLDLNTMELRINCCNGRYIYPKVYALLKIDLSVNCMIARYINGNDF